jgi:hypothetical protein
MTPFNCILYITSSGIMIANWKGIGNRLPRKSSNLFRGTEITKALNMLAFLRTEMQQSNTLTKYKRPNLSQPLCSVYFTTDPEFYRHRYMVSSSKHGGWRIPRCTLVLFMFWKWHINTWLCRAPYVLFEVLYVLSTQQAGAVHRFATLPGDLKVDMLQWR